MDGEGGFVPSTAGLVTRGLVVRTTGVDLGRPANLRLLRIMRVTVITAIAVTAAAFALLPNARTSTAQPPAGDALQAATRGLALIDSAIAANGGLDRLRAVQDVTIRYRGRRWMAHQSETASPPWNVQPTLTDVVIDIQNNRLMRHNVTRYAQPNGSLYTLWLDAATKRLARLEWLADDPVEGDQLRSYDYSGYRAERGIQVPMRLVERRNGELVRDDSLAITIDEHPTDALFTPPATGYVEAGPLPAPEREPIRKLADNVWLLQQLPGGNRAMFVAFRDYVLVLEAPTPQVAADSVLEAVKRTVPGKPVRYVAFSHHHDDHGGGLRPYIAQGVTIVTTPETRQFVEKVASAKHMLRPDALSASPRAPVIETFRKKRVFTDGEMTVELHDIGPTSHVNEIVLAYFPKERLVFQGDLIIIAPRGSPAPANALTAELAQALERLHLDVETIAGVHGRVGTIGDLREAIAKRRP
jgi:glyoxylase-like metal-dependent hydrolase (beta-lactamase superfamily II)